MDHKRNSDLHKRKKTPQKSRLTNCTYKSYRDNLNHLIRKNNKNIILGTFLMLKMTWKQKYGRK